MASHLVRPLYSLRKQLLTRISIFRALTHFLRNCPHHPTLAFLYSAGRQRTPPDPTMLPYRLVEEYIKVSRKIFRLHIWGRK